MNDESIGARLKILRKGKKLTQDEVARQLEISRSALCNYEIGRRNPSIKELKRLAEFYGVSLDYFGISTQDEVFELISRATDIFKNENISDEQKRDLYEEIMRLYLSLKRG